jgi:hypothetical protein
MDLIWIYIYLYNILRKMPAAYVVIFLQNPFAVHFDDENSFFYSMHTQKKRNCRFKNYSATTDEVANICYLIFIGMILFISTPIMCIVIKLLLWFIVKGMCNLVKLNETIVNMTYYYVFKYVVWCRTWILCLGGSVVLYSRTSYSDFDVRLC